MRNILLPLLLASVAASPAMASRPPDRDSDEGRVQVQRAVDTPAPPPRPEQADFGTARSEPREQPVQVREPRAPRPMTSDPGWARGGPDADPLHAGRDPRPAIDRGGASESIDEVQRRFEKREQIIRETRGDDAQPHAWGDRENRGSVGRGPAPQISRVPRPGTQPPARTDLRRSPVQWDHRWRDDHRYDWRDQRHRHHNLFHLGIYYDPFGWGYSPYQAGWRMWPDYYSSRYWINDPWMYRLPYAPPGTRWIRYWNDALLVDLWSGEVIDRIPDFFW